MSRRTTLSLLVIMAGLVLISVAVGWSLLQDRDRAGISAQAAIHRSVPSLTPPPVLQPQPTTTPTETPVPTDVLLIPSTVSFDGEEAMHHVEAQLVFGPRPTGSEASRQVADYILAYLHGLGWQTETLPFIYQGVEGQNLLARAGRTDGPIFLFGAHYDTRRRADQDAVVPDQPVPGANDGASGVAVLLELARVLDLDAVEGQVWLVFFDAEDNGHLDGWEYIAGSRLFVQSLQVVPEYIVVVDMVGDVEQNIYLEMNSDPLLSSHLWQVAADLGYGEYMIARPGHSILDDHIPFLEAGIPAVDIIDFDYPYWHTTQDTADKVSAESLERVGRVLEAFLEMGGTYPGSPAR